MPKNFCKFCFQIKKGTFIWKVRYFKNNRGNLIFNSYYFKLFYLERSTKSSFSIFRYLAPFRKEYNNVRKKYTFLEMLKKQFKISKNRTGTFCKSLYEQLLLWTFTCMLNIFLNIHICYAHISTFHVTHVYSVYWAMYRMLYLVHLYFLILQQVFFILLNLLNDTYLCL